MGEFLLYPIIFAAVGWAARLAKTKGQNPWIWGGAAVLLSLLHVPQTALLSVLPALVLLFMKSPSVLAADEENRLACARCAKPHSDGQHFCTGCGWDLSEAYSPEATDESQPFPAPTPVQTTMPSSGVSQPVETTEPSVQEETTPVADVSTHEKPTDEEPVVSTDVVEEDVAEEQPATEHVPWGTYDPGVAPTAAVMVSRGVERFEEKKYQEAIDQFTKAIALDPNYAEAWEKRAEAYAQMGRSEQAADDRRHLQGLDPSSSPG